VTETTNLLDNLLSVDTDKSAQQFTFQNIGRNATIYKKMILKSTSGTLQESFLSLKLS